MKLVLKNSTLIIYVSCISNHFATCLNYEMEFKYTYACSGRESYQVQSLKQSYSKSKKKIPSHIYWVWIEIYMWQFQVLIHFKCCTYVLYSSSQVSMDAGLVSLLFSVISIFILIFFYTSNITTGVHSMKTLWSSAHEQCTQCTTYNNVVYTLFTLVNKVNR